MKASKNTAPKLHREYCVLGTRRKDLGTGTAENLIYHARHTIGSPYAREIGNTCRTKAEAMERARWVIDYWRATDRPKTEHSRAGLVGIESVKDTELQKRLEFVQWRLRVHYVSDWETAEEHNL